VEQGATPVATYAYDAFGQRLLKSLPGSPATTTLYQYDLSGHPIEDSNVSTGTPAPLADYIYLGNEPVGLVLGSVLYYYHDDHLGTPQLVTDSGSAIQWTGTYQPFGPLTITGSITQNLRLPGQYADAETTWSNNGFRTYAPNLCSRAVRPTITILIAALSAARGPSWRLTEHVLYFHPYGHNGAVNAEGAYP
jgi:uncharacterized protein RhaS with RHS repeats